MGSSNLCCKKERWKEAQAAERKLWSEILSKSDIESYSEKYSWKKEVMMKRFSSYIKIDNRTRFLQIGCACIDVINFIDKGRRYSIDPLADTFKQLYGEIVDYNSSNLVKGVGESLPYKDEFFDVVILANVLDHTYDPLKVLKEVHRVLKKDGILYFENNFYQKSFLLLAKVYGFIKENLFRKTFNVCHPFMFSLSDLRNIVSKDFSIEEERVYEDLFRRLNSLYDLKKHLRKGKMSQKILSYFGLYGTINYTAICKKK